MDTIKYDSDLDVEVLFDGSEQFEPSASSCCCCCTAATSETTEE